MTATVARWLGPVDAADAHVLELAEAPVIDLGCGPGRHAAALLLDGNVGIGGAPEALLRRTRELLAP